MPSYVKIQTSCEPIAAFRPAGSGAGGARWRTRSEGQEVESAFGSLIVSNSVASGRQQIGKHRSRDISDQGIDQPGEYGRNVAAQPDRFDLHVCAAIRLFDPPVIVQTPHVKYPWSLPTGSSCSFGLSGFSTSAILVEWEWLSAREGPDIA